MVKYSTVFRFNKGEEEYAKLFEDICFGLSNKDATFEYKIRRYKDGNIVFYIISTNKDIAYKRGELLKAYYENATTDNGDTVKIYYKVVKMR